MPITTSNAPSTTPNTGRVSIYGMRERVIMNKMTEAMSKLAPDTETEVTSRLHQEIPAIRLDGHLTYCLYITLQNLIHINAVYIFLYHAVFWLGSTQFHTETVQSTHVVEKNQYEETQLVTIGNLQYSNIGTSINIKVINKSIYLTLIAVGSFELINAFLWTLRKKLPSLLQRHQRLKSYLSQLLVVCLLLVYLSLIGGILYHTFVTERLPQPFTVFILSHLVVLTLLDKPNLFQQSPYQLSKQVSTARKLYRNSTSSSSTSSMTTSAIARHSYRGSAAKKITTIAPSASSSPSLASWSRWSSIMEEKIDVHECSTFYAQARDEADELWSIVLRRIAVNLYRTCTSVILYDVIPLHMMGQFSC